MKLVKNKVEKCNCYNCGHKESLVTVFEDEFAQSNGDIKFIYSASEMCLNCNSLLGSDELVSIVKKDELIQVIEC